MLPEIVLARGKAMDGSSCDGPVTIDEVMRATGLSRGSVYAALRRGDLPGRKIGNRIVITRPAWERWLAGQGDEVAA